MILERRLLESYTDLKAYFLSKGFTISNDGKMRWGEANQNSLCYWQFDDSVEELNFIDSNGNEIFPFSLCDFNLDRITGVALLNLKDDGIAVNITPLNEGTSATDFTISCALGYSVNNAGQIIMNESVPQNGLVVCTPAEQDGKWRYSWRATPAVNTNQNCWLPSSFIWTIDNTNGSVIPGREISTVSRWELSNVITITKTFLSEGFWSDYIYTQVVGINESPGRIITTNGQKYITLCPETLTECDAGGTVYDKYNSPPRRCPCFPLEPDRILINNSSSTEPYSRYTKYKQKDYCTYNGLVYRCLSNIDVPEPFNTSHWTVTTVPDELLNN